jgi:tripartite-type tricarboxylate transporter receptor subunit TctC
MGELLNLMGKVDLVHVPYKGSAETAIATAAGHIDISFPSVASVGPLLESRKLRAIAVTGGKRATSLPSIPTIIRGADSARTCSERQIGQAGGGEDEVARG